MSVAFDFADADAPGMITVRDEVFDEILAAVETWPGDARSAVARQSAERTATRHAITAKVDGTTRARVLDIIGREVARVLAARGGAA